MTQYIEQLPIIPFSNKNEIHVKISLKVKGLLSLKNDLIPTKSSHERSVIERQIGATDREIDKLVYQLYDLTEDEIKIIEESV